MTKTTYDAIGDHFRGLWGKEAGWAHSVLFTADLRAFSAKGIVKTLVGEVKTEIDTETWEILKTDFGVIKAEKSTETCDDIYIKDEILPEIRLKRVIAEDDKVVIAEQISATRKAKRRRAR